MTALALCATLGGVAPVASADSQAAARWSSTYESGQPQPLAASALDTPVGVHGTTSSIMRLVTSVYSPDGGKGGENAGMIADRNSATKWFAGKKPTASNSIEVIYSLSEAAVATSYQLVSGNDSKERDPKSWQVFGSNSDSAATAVGDGSWTPIASEENVDLGPSGSSGRNYSSWFDVDQSASYRYYKLKVVDNQGASGAFQLADWTLLSSQDISEGALVSDPQSAISSATSSYSNAGNENETLDALRDRRYDSKWLGTAPEGGPTTENPGIITYTLSSAQKISSYDIVSGNDAVERDPKNWTIRGTNDAAALNDQSSESWKVIDTVSDATWTGRKARNHYDLDEPGSYKYIQMVVTANAGNNNRLQMGDWTLYGTNDAAPQATSVLAVSTADIRATNQSSELSTAHGSAALRYDGQITPDAESAVASNSVVHDDLNVTIADGTALSYDIDPLTAEGAKVIADIAYTDANGTNEQFLSQLSGVSDSAGVSFTPAAYGTALTQNAWNHVRVDLSALAGKVVTRVVLRFADAEAQSGAKVTGLIDNVTVAANGFAGSLRLNDVPASFTAYAGKAVNGSVGVIAGAALVPSDATIAATLDLNDGHDALSLVATKTADGYVLTVPAAARVAAAGQYDATISVSVGEETAVAQLPVTVIADSTLTTATASIANLTCFVQSGIAGDCDGNGYAYDRAKLTDLGYSFGANGTVNIDGTTFNFEVPNIPVGQPDTITPAGQRWNITVPQGATKLSFLGTANEGTKSRELTIVYTDETEQNVTVTFGDWATGDTSNFTNNGNTVVARPQGRLKGASESDDKYSAVLASAPVDLQADKTVDYIQLPVKSGTLKPDGQVHLFTFATDAAVAAQAPAPVLEATSGIEATPGVALTSPLVTVTTGQAPLTATINWGDGSPVTTGSVVDGKVFGDHAYQAVGTYTAVVTVTGNGTSATQSVTIAVGKHAATVALSGPAASPVGAAGSVVATIQPATATGTVQFVVDGQASGAPVQIADAKASFDISTLPAGSHTIVATYSGDDTTSSATSAAHTVVINKVASAVTLSGVETATVGASNVLTATVTPATATGTVQFVVDGQASGAPVQIADAKASFDISTLPAGSHTIVATYSGDDATSSATSAAHTVVINKVASAVTLSGVETATVGASNVLTATVTPATATGTVQFAIDGAAAGEPVALTAGAATFNTQVLTAGTHTITATYLGNEQYAQASVQKTLTITKVASSLVIDANATTVTVGDPITLTATLSPATAGKTVAFFAGDEELGTATTDAQGKATWALNASAEGTTAYRATFAGDDTLTQAQTDQSVSVTVSKKELAAGDVVIAIPEEVTAGADQELSITLPADATGTVTFTINGVAHEVNVVDGKASFGTSSLPVGDSTITITYSGDSKYGSMTTTKDVYVDKARPAVTVTADKTNATFGASVVVTAQVPAGTTGTVTFEENGQALGDPIAIDAEGLASITISTPAAGEHTITANYSGDANNEASTSSVEFTIDQADTTVTLSSADSTIKAGKPVALTATVDPAAAGGTVTFLQDGKAIGEPVTVQDGIAILSVPDLAVGSYVFTAKFTGDTNYAGSESSALNVSVEAVKVPVVPALGVVSASGSKQVYGQVDAAKLIAVSVQVTNATAGTVVFSSDTLVIATAQIQKVNGAYVAKARLESDLAVGKYGSLRATALIDGKLYVTTVDGAGFTITKPAVAKAIKVRAKKFKAGKRPKVTVTVGKLSNGRVATGSVKITVGKKYTKTVKLRNGKAKVTLKRSKKTIKVRAQYRPDRASNGLAAKSKVVKVKVRK
ncbi:Ig-like domain repeat protein [Rarobacter incanus]|uniref:Ig-like domain repeat protein n=1 Tax=Rarobacter incanus TaxID=153494 RepID=UPI001477391F|nr:Ig-like domain repeat protein [Rarobacter incanus]